MHVYHANRPLVICPLLSSPLSRPLLTPLFPLFRPDRDSVHIRLSKQGKPCRLVIKMALPIWQTTLLPQNTTLCCFGMGICYAKNGPRTGDLVRRAVLSGRKNSGLESILAALQGILIPCLALQGYRIDSPARS